jgi:hypothetical protein
LFELANGFFEALAGAEAGHGHFRNVDFVAGLRVNAAAGRALTEVKRSKPVIETFSPRATVRSIMFTSVESVFSTWRLVVLVSAARVSISCCLVMGHSKNYYHHCTEWLQIGKG